MRPEETGRKSRESSAVPVYVLSVNKRDQEREKRNEMIDEK